MSFFDFFKNKPTATNTTTSVELPEEQTITWENTFDPDLFFQGYEAAVTDLENNGKVAAAETLRANQSKLQLAFLTRFEKQLQNDLQHIADSEMKTDHIIASVNAVRVYNKQMNVTVRARLAQTKKHLIGEEI